MTPRLWEEVLDGLKDPDENLLWHVQYVQRPHAPSRGLVDILSEKGMFFLELPFQTELFLQLVLEVDFGAVSGPAAPLLIPVARRISSYNFTVFQNFGVERGLRRYEAYDSHKTSDDSPSRSDTLVRIPEVVVQPREDVAVFSPGNGLRRFHV
ncbi:hypothetical protein VTK56DRAFT_4861 [Thermocarpiscus australiensis]